jgi:hypothetical protein
MAFLKNTETPYVLKNLLMKKSRVLAEKGFLSVDDARSLAHEAGL